MILHYLLRFILEAKQSLDNLILYVFHQTMRAKLCIYLFLDKKISLVSASTEG